MPTTPATPSSSSASSDNDSSSLSSIANKVESLQTRITSVITNSGRSNHDPNLNKKLLKPIGSKYLSFL